MRGSASRATAVSATWGASLALALGTVQPAAVSATHAVDWSLKPASHDALARWSIPTPAPVAGAPLAILPDPTGGPDASAASPLPQDFSIAPSVDNILNSRHDLSQDQIGEPGNPGGYLRSVGRTFGLALKKSLY